MLLIPVLTVLLSHGLAASPYVVMEDDGYYRTWRSNPKTSEINPWSTFMAPQMYFPFLQNFNPFSWWQPQSPPQQDDRDIKNIRERQDAIFDILKCLVEFDNKNVCKTMLRNAMVLFPEINKITQREPLVLQISASFEVEPPMGPKPSEAQKPPIREPAEMQPTPIETKKPPTQQKATEAETPSMGVLLIMETNPINVEKKPMVESSMQPENPSITKHEMMEPKPMEAEKVSAMQPNPTEHVNPSMAESAMMEPQPIETEKPSVMEAKNSSEMINSKPMEAEKPSVMQPIEHENSEDKQGKKVVTPEHELTKTKRMEMQVNPIKNVPEGLPAKINISLDSVKADSEATSNSVKEV